MAPKIPRILAGFAVLVGLLLLAVLVLGRNTAPPPFPALPNPNGYDDLVKAGSMVVGTPSDYPTLDEPGLISVVASNAATLKLARLGLGRPCVVPLQKFTDTTNAAWLEDIANIKKLAQCLTAEARLAEVQHRPAESARMCQDTLRMGQAIANTGGMIHCLVGFAVDNLACAQLDRVSGSLDGPQCRQLSVFLQELDQKREALPAILGHERAWMRRMYGLRGELARLVTLVSVRQTEKRFEQKFVASQVRLRRLAVSLACRSFAADKGAAPKTIGELVPDYLKSVPKDPVTGAEMQLP